jgi:hypothetical protein
MHEQGVMEGQSAGIHVARGSVRDGLAALQNFENLLRSPRIGPRSLGRMVGELRDCCEPIGEALGTLIGEIAVREPAAGVVPQLADYASTCMTQLDGALLRADRREFGAKARLALESEVHQITGELGTLRRLLDLLEAATCARMAELEAGALVEASLNALCGERPAPGPVVQVHVVQLPSALAVHTDPRVAMQLLGIGVGVVADGGAKAVRIEVSVRDEHTALIRLSPGRSADKATSCPAPRIIAPSLEVAGLACRALGAGFAPGAGDCELSLPLAAPLPLLVGVS